MPHAHAEQNLLVGFLALQLNFVNREQFLAGMNAWITNKSCALADILQDQGALLSDVRPLLDALVAKHISMHGDDPQTFPLKPALKTRRFLAMIIDVHTIPPGIRPKPQDQIEESEGPAAIRTYPMQHK
jgi:hypothetical protein